MGKDSDRAVSVRTKWGDTSEEKWGDGANTKFNDGWGRMVGSVALCPAHSLSGALGTGSSNHRFLKGSTPVSSILCYNLHVLGRELLGLEPESFF